MQAWKSPPSVQMSLAAILAFGIFTADTIASFEAAFAVLYVIVILLSASVLTPRGLVIVGLGCRGLTLASFVIVHGVGDESAVLRFLVSLCAIATTTFLTLRNQQAIRQADDRAALLDLTHDAIFVRDLRNGCDRISYWNEGAGELYGWSGGEVLGKDVGQLLKTRLPISKEAIWRQLEVVGRWEGELIHTRRDGVQVVVNSRWSLQRDAHGLPAAILELNNNITQRRQVEDGLHQVQAELAHATRVTMLGELVTSIAHELRQPLASVVADGYAGRRWLLRENSNLEEVRSSLERMISNAQRADDVITRLRALTSKAPIRHAVFDLNGVVSVVLPLLERELATHAVTLNLSLAEGLEPFRGDRVQMQQVLINLMMNALQAMAGVTERARVLSIRSWMQRDGSQPRTLVLEVRDTGIGLEPGGEAHLFNAFYTTKASGMGIGLSICRSIIEAHGGCISADGSSTAGAAFTITVPAFDPETVMEQCDLLSDASATLNGERAALASSSGLRAASQASLSTETADRGLLATAV